MLIDIRNYTHSFQESLVTVSLSQNGKDWTVEMQITKEGYEPSKTVYPYQSEKDAKMKFTCLVEALEVLGYSRFKM